MTDSSPICKLFVPMVPPSPNKLRGKHWSKYHKLRAEWEHALHYAPGSSKAKLRLIIQPQINARIAIGIHIVHGKVYDPDNLVASCKPVLDALKRCLYIKDDSPKHITLTVTQGDRRTEPEGTTITLSAA